MEDDTLEKKMMERENVLHNNNNERSAQQNIADLLKTLPNNITTFDITQTKLKNETLSGDIDFSIFEKYDFKMIKTIILGEKNKITQIIHLPPTLETLYCPNNLLISLENVPSSLQDLNVSGNLLSHIDLRETPHLVKLNLSHNQFQEIDYLPPFIKELNVSDNNISKLELLDLNKLQILNCLNNHGIVLNNVPPQLKNIKMNDEFLISNEEIKEDTRNVSKEKKMELHKNYVEALNDYFKLKNQYEKKEKQLKKKQNKSKGVRQNVVLPPCVNCKRPVGSIFTKGKQNNKYMVICGDSVKPCNLNIQIYSGEYFDLNEMLLNFKEHMEELKQYIIEQKLQTLFNFQSDTVSTTLFKKTLEEFNTNNEMYKDLLDKYNHLHNNKHKQELIKLQNNKIQEIKGKMKNILKKIKMDEEGGVNATTTKEMLKTVVDMHVNSLMPEISNLQKMKYEIIEMEKTENNVYVLHQQEHHYSKNLQTYDEPAKVIKYTK